MKTAGDFYLRSVETDCQPANQPRYPNRWPVYDAHLPWCRVLNVGIEIRKYKFDTIVDNENLNVSTKDGWVAMLQQYFTTAWVPHNAGTNSFYTANLGNGVVAIGYKSQPVLVQPGQTDKLESILGRSGHSGQNGCRRAAPI